MLVADLNIFLCYAYGHTNWRIIMVVMWLFFFFILEPSADPSDEVQVGDYTFTRDSKNILDEGGFGVVWKGKKRAEEDGAIQVAIKEVKIKRNTRKYVEREKTNMLKLTKMPHDNIVKLYGLQQSGLVMYIILELCNLGDLNKFMKHQPQKTFDFCLECFSCTAAAVRHIHNKVRLCHRDIKPRNILLTGDRSNFKIKLADFGLSRTLEHSPSCTPRELTRGVGTRGWMAPEIPLTRYASRAFSFPVDVFSLGLLFWSVISHQPGYDLQFPEGKFTL